jgi:hypothetical protein
MKYRSSSILYKKQRSSEQWKIYGNRFPVVIAGCYNLLQPFHLKSAVEIVSVIVPVQKLYCRSLQILVFNNLDKNLT